MELKWMWLEFNEQEFWEGIWIEPYHTIPSDHKTTSISLTNQNPDFLKPLIISIDTFDLWEAEHPNLVLSTDYPNIPQFDHNTSQANLLSIPPSTIINKYFQLHKVNAD